MKDVTDRQARDLRQIRDHYGASVTRREAEALAKKGLVEVVKLRPVEFGAWEAKLTHKGRVELIRYEEKAYQKKKALRGPKPTGEKT